MGEISKVHIIDNCIKCNHLDPRQEKIDDVNNIVCGNCGFTMFVSGRYNFVFNGKDVPPK